MGALVIGLTKKALATLKALATGKRVSPTLDPPTVVEIRKGT